MPPEPLQPPETAPPVVATTAETQEPLTHYFLQGGTGPD